MRICYTKVPNGDTKSNQRLQICIPLQLKVRETFEATESAENLNEQLDDNVASSYIPNAERDCLFALLIVLEKVFDKWV